MRSGDVLHVSWVSLGCYVLGIVSAVVPWVNAEVVMLGAVPLTGSHTALGTFVLAVTAGQMTGKSIMYWLARRASRARPSIWRDSVDRWRARLKVDQRPRSAMTVVFVSSLVGFPPFYLVSVAAGALEMAFGPFLALGSVGRLLHFGVIAWLPHVVRLGL